MAPRNRVSRGALALLLLAALGVAGCTRSRPSPTPQANVVPPIPASPDVVVPTVAPTVIQVTEPAEGASVSAPIRVSGTVELGPGRQLAAQVFSQGADGSRAWRGNGLLTVDPDGGFEGTLTYTLADPTPGVVEIAVVDTASGAVFERLSINVNLAAAP